MNVCISYEDNLLCTGEFRISSLFDICNSTLLICLKLQVDFHPFCFQEALAPDFKGTNIEAKRRAGSFYLETSAAWSRFVEYFDMLKKNKGQINAETKGLRFVNEVQFKPKAKTVAYKKKKKKTGDAAEDASSEEVSDNEANSQDSKTQIFAALKAHENIKRFVIDHLIVRMHQEETMINDSNKGAGNKAQHNTKLVINNTLSFDVPLIKYWNKVKDDSEMPEQKIELIEVPEQPGLSSTSSATARSKLGKTVQATSFSTRYKPVFTSEKVELFLCHGDAAAKADIGVDVDLGPIRTGVIDVPRGTTNSYDLLWPDTNEKVPCIDIYWIK